jgi:hypothetical protein
MNGQPPAINHSGTLIGLWRVILIHGVPRHGPSARMFKLRVCLLQPSITVTPYTHPLQSLQDVMLSKTTMINQCEIPGEPPSAVVRHYSLGAVTELQIDLRAAIPTNPPVAVGVSVGLAPLGAEHCIQTIALATRDKVFCLSLPQSPSPTQRKALQGLFSNIQYLTGFDFPHIIVLLAHTLGSIVTGYDLTTLRLRSKHDITTPGNFLNLKNPNTSARRINERWDGDVLRNGANSTATPEPDHALRAWFTAMYVISHPPHHVPRSSAKLALPTWPFQTYC